MRIVLLVAVAVFAVRAASVDACSYPVREHPILASHPPDSVPNGMIAIQLAITEVMLPARFANSPDVWNHSWEGIRGETIAGESRPSTGSDVEIVGQTNITCFYPGDSYRLSPDGRLIVWVTGTWLDDQKRSLALPATDVSTMPRIRPDGAWRKVIWQNADDGRQGSSPALPSSLEPGMIQQ